MSYAKLSLPSASWTLIAENTSTLTFQNVGQQQVYITTTISNTAPTDVVGTVYDLWQGETSVKLIEPNKYVWAKALTGVGTVIVDTSGPSISTRPAYDSNNDMMKVQSTQKKWRDSFVGLLTEDWDVVTTGGMTATLDSGVLTIATGTTAGAYAELLSKETFTVPFRAMFGLQTGTRISNQHLYVEAVSVDPSTGLPDGQNMMAWDVGGQASVTQTQGVYEVQNGGLRPFASGASTITSTTTYSILELEPFADEAYFHSRAIDSANSRSNSYPRHQQIPNPNALYKLRIRALLTSAWMNITGAVNNSGIALTVAAHGYTTGDQVWVECLNGVTNGGNPVRGLFTITVIDTNTIRLNGTTFGGSYVNGSGRVSRAASPASSSNFQFQFASCTDYAELTAEITAGRGQTAVGQSLGVNVTSGTLNTILTTYFDETATNLAAGATFTGSSRDLGASAGNRVIGVAKFNLLAFADQAGTMRIEFSRDGTTWRRGTVDTAVAANTPTLVSMPIMARYYRVIYVNGATTQTSFMLQSSFTPA